MTRKRRKRGQKERLLRRDGTPMRILRMIGEQAEEETYKFVFDTKRSAFTYRGARRRVMGPELLPDRKREAWKYRARIRGALNRLVEKKLVRIVEGEEGQEIHITDRGLGAMKRDRIEDDVKVKKQRWDGKWRIILFDIPETKRVARDAIRQILGNAGFFQLQQSVYVAPYPCEKQVMAVADYFEIGDCVTCAEASRIGRQEKQARKHFGLS